MPELQFADGVLARLHEAGPRKFDERAYLFVLSSIEFLQRRLDQRRHVSGTELTWACRDYALQQFGLLSRTVLKHWGVADTADFGHIVFALVDIGLLSTQPNDTIDDFENVYDFTQAFDENYPIAWRRDA